METRQFSTNKYTFHGDRILSWQNGENPFAVTTEIDLCGFCNHKCSFCHFAGKHNREMFTFDDALAVIPQLARLGCKTVVLTGGGEPTLNPSISDIIYLIRNYKMGVGLVTNGTALDRIQSTALEELSWIRVSLDASNPEVYRKMHGVGEAEFDRVLNNVAKVSINRSASTVLGLAYMVTEDTYPYLAEATHMAKNLGVDYIQFRPLLNPRLNFDQTVVDELTALSTDGFKVLFSFDRFFHRHKRNYRTCLGNFFVCVISADKDVYVCCHMRGDKRYVIGNLNDDVMETIWARRQAVPVTKDCPEHCRLHYANQMLQSLTDENIQHIDFL